MDLPPSMEVLRTSCRARSHPYTTFNSRVALQLLFCLILIWVPLAGAQTEPPEKLGLEQLEKGVPTRGRIRDFDIRIQAAQESLPARGHAEDRSLTERREAQMLAFQHRFGEGEGALRVTLSADGLPASVSRDGGFLSGPRAGNPRHCGPP